MGRLVYVRSSRAWHFQDPPTYRDWKRYVFYARRVRTLTHRDRDGDSHDGPKALSPDIISQLNQFAQFDSALLLPNLKSIHWGTSERGRANTLQVGDVTPFLSPSVKEIHIKTTFDMTEHEAIRIVQNLSLVPDLQLSKFSLTTVSPTEPNTQLIQPFSNFLAQQRRIAHLAFPPIYPMERSLFTETVGHLEYLTALHITLPVSYFSDCAGSGL
ncbi:hypothetical protein FRC00_012989 [Tulasnella sp. 408]|nr:hypothetical protein FRC00_012989 [Tulasnella sp. 408]